MNASSKTTVYPFPGDVFKCQTSSYGEDTFPEWSEIVIIVSCGTTHVYGDLPMADVLLYNLTRGCMCVDVANTFGHDNIFYKKLSC